MRTTNADRIRRMSVEELSEFFQTMWCGCFCGHFVLQFCMGDKEVKIFQTVPRIKEWLEREVEE